MSKLPLATWGAAATLGLLAAAAQAEPVTLSLSQMDEVTAGQIASGSNASVAISATVEPGGFVTAIVTASASATDPQGNLVACETAISAFTSPPSGTVTVTTSCGCESATFASISAPS